MTDNRQSQLEIVLFEFLHLNFCSFSRLDLGSGTVLAVRSGVMYCHLLKTEVIDGFVLRVKLQALNSK